MWRTQSQVHRVRCLAQSLKTQLGFSRSASHVCAIRREDNSVWERRAPLAPHHVKSLVQSGVKVIVQPSNRRAYPMQAYARAGAIISEDISEAPVILGVKQVPIDLLEPSKTYVFFSHTIKAQEANMPMLDAILEKKIRLIDYEKMVDGKGRRLVAFGKYAGVTGMINILHGLGLRLLALGHHTPFMHVGPAHNYRNSMAARQAIRDAGYEICLDLMPKSLGPLTFVFCGAGNVSQGAQEVFCELPYEYVTPENLSKVARHGATDRVYATVIDMADHLVRREGGGFDEAEFLAHPERYASTFSHKYAPYASCIVNGIYYAPGAPRLLTIPDAKNLLQPIKAPWLPASSGCPRAPHHLLAVCDISADPGGSIEFMKECTTIDHPFVLYDADENVNTRSFAGDGVLICSIENMPAQIPNEATDFFGSMLFPYIYDILSSDATKPFNSYDAVPVVKDSVIASNGALTEKYKYIDALRGQQSSYKAQLTAQAGKKNVLILGAGYVSAPVVDYLTRDDSVAVTVAAAMKEEVDSLASRFPNTTPLLLDLDRSHDDVEELVKSHNLVISLLPYHLHPEVAKMCIKHKTNMVTASYRLPAMLELDQAAKDAGITVMNEVGVDPGIDHMLAMECFDDLKDKGANVTSFISWCGGLPAPECSNNPIRYKFSWSPLGVLRNVTAGARFLEDGQVKEIGTGGELLHSIRNMDFLPGFNLEGYPNRDSVQYGELYGIRNATTIIRGTLRIKGFSDAMGCLLKSGLLGTEGCASLHPGGPDITWRAFMCELLGQRPDVFIDTLKSVCIETHGQFTTKVIDDLGLFDMELIDKKHTPIETLSNYLSKKLAFEEHERDLIVMHHKVSAEFPDGDKETREINFVAYGRTIKDYSAMAATVGFPCGIASKMVLDGEIQEKGMIVPFARNIYRPILKRLKALGLQAVERIEQH